MTLEEDIKSFILWATNLGFPINDMPNDEALKSIFKSRQRDLFCNLMQRVQPRNDVIEIRHNILSKKLMKLRDQIVPASSRSSLPKEVQTFLKIKELKLKKADLDFRIRESKKAYELLAVAIKTKNMQYMKLNEKRETLNSKVTLLSVKSASLHKSITQEDRNKERVLTIMPVKLTPKNACEVVAAAAVDVAIKDLDEFYTFHLNNTNPRVLKDAKEVLWRKLRLTFANIPNFMILNAIVRSKEEQLQSIISFNKSNIEDSQIRNTNRDPHSTFDIKLMKTKAEILGITAKYLAARHECDVLEERFSNLYPLFVDELQKKVNLFNDDNDEHVDDIISDYIVQYNLRNFSKSQNEFLSQRIEICKTNLELNSRQLDDHEVLLGSIKQVYSEINTSINRIQYEILQLNKIKEKIIYSKNMLHHMLRDLHTSTSNANTGKSNFLPSKLKLSANNSMLVGESFEMGGDVFSSTKLDFDSTISLNNSTLRRSLGCGELTLSTVESGILGGRYTLPPYLTELCTFAEIPFNKFSNMSRECSFHISPNPLILTSRELSSTIQLSPGILLTSFGALQEVRSRIQLAEAINEITTELKPDVQLTIVDPNDFKSKVKKQREHVIELLDKIDVSLLNTNHSLMKVGKLYDFILENTLRNYIPLTKCFNNQTFLDYESEYTMYYRMATVGSSNK